MKYLKNQSYKKFKSHMILKAHTKNNKTKII